MRQSRRRSLTIRAAVILALLSTPLLGAGPALAEPPYDPDTHETTVDLPNNPTQPVGCSAYTWTSPPKIVLHLTEFYAGGGDLGDALRLIGAVDAVNDQFNVVGATSARVTTLETTTDPFVYDALAGDTVPTIHIGFMHDFPGKTDSTVGETRSFNLTNCHRAETHIRFRDIDFNDGWNFDTPESFYDEDHEYDGADALYFRPVYLHELLHAFGLHHSLNTYAFMNYGVKPWANRPEHDSIRPLPDDVEKLRDLYPQAGSRTEVAVLNTWYDPDETSNGAAIQKLLCMPSQGVDWAASRFWGNHCGVDADGFPGSTRVCTGDTLRARFALANYSTASVDVTARLWFSTDDVWDIYDVISPTEHTFTVSAQGSAQQGRTWEVPRLSLNRDYRPIIRVTAVTPSGATAGDWIPLIWTVHSCELVPSLL